MERFNKDYSYMVYRLILSMRQQEQKIRELWK